MKKWLYFIFPCLSPVTRLVTPIFDHAHSKNSWSAFNFWWSCINMQKITLYIPSVHSSNTVNFRVPWPDWPHQFLTMLTRKIFNHLLICAKLYQHAKNQLVPSVRSWDTVNFRVQRPDWPHSFVTMPHQKLFNQLLIFGNLYQHAKNQAVSSICSAEMLDLKICQSELLRAFWSISQE